MRYLESLAVEAPTQNKQALAGLLCLYICSVIIWGVDRYLGDSRLCESKGVGKHRVCDAECIPCTIS